MAETNVVEDIGVTHAPSSLGHFPGTRWEFDESVTDVFEDMLARSIPHISAMRDIVYETATRFIRPETDIVDLGCARGEAMARLMLKYGSANRFVGVEVSDAMLDVCRNRFKEAIQEGWVDIRKGDLQNSYPPVNASLTLCVLTLQFVPLEHRARVLEDIHSTTRPGGSLILVEKILGETGVTDRLLVDLYYEHKRTMGYSQAEIDAKRASLAGILVPLTASWNEELLRRAGFRHIECIWRSMNFCGWVAIA